MSLPLYDSSSFNVFQSHLQGSQVDISTSPSNLISIGSDDILCEYTKDSQTIISTIENPHGYQVSNIFLHPIHKNILVIGTDQGNVIQFCYSHNPTNNNTVLQSKTIYRVPSPLWQKNIRQMKFTANGLYLIIVTSQLFCVIYDMSNNLFFKHKLPSQTEILTVVTDYSNQFLALLDFEGKAHIFKISKKQIVEKMEIQDPDDPFAVEQQLKKTCQTDLTLIATYKFGSQKWKNLINKYSVIASFNHDNSFLAQNLYLPGQSTLQKIQLTLPPAAFSSQYQLCPSIFHPTQILQILWLKNKKAGLILTTTQFQGIIWHEQKQQKVMIFNFSHIFGSPEIKVKNLCVRSFNQHENWGFAFVTLTSSKEIVSSKIYDFKGFTQLQRQLIKHELNQMSIQEEQKQQELGIEEQSNRNIEQKHKKILPQQSIASKLLTVYLEPSLTTGYEMYTGDTARFLYYNNIGCIIERQVLNKQSFLQLQFHDRSKISRIRIEADSLLQHFALCNDTLVTASINRMSVQCQKHLKEGYSWQYAWESIEGVAIGGDWICGVNKSEIKVWDWVGNQLHSVAFDRKFVAIAAYEDLLAIVYHSGLPMWGAQSYSMLIYEVKTSKIKCIRQTTVPCKPTTALKWFGFSEQGMLFSQDQAEILRCYLFEKDQWQVTLCLDPLVQRLFIQHIENYEVYGFRLDQKFPNQPRVFPRSLPRKVPLDLSTFKIPYLNVEQNDYIKKHKLSQIWIEHEKYRYERWYRLKYSRSKDNRWYERSMTVKSQQEIRDSEGKMDLKLMEYVKRYLKIHKNEQQSRKNLNKLLMLSCSLCYYEETKNRLRESIQQSANGLGVDLQGNRVYCLRSQSSLVKRENREEKRNVSQLDRLEQMMGLKWLDNQIGIQNNLMELY